MRCVNTRVLPEPAPAMMSTGPSVVSTASLCLSFIPLRIVCVAINEVPPCSICVYNQLLILPKKPVPTKGGLDAVSDGSNLVRFDPIYIRDAASEDDDPPAVRRETNSTSDARNGASLVLIMSCLLQT